jgi:hypothetical protein
MWLQTEESKSVGHQSGERIAAILDKKAAGLTDIDVDQLHRTVRNVKRQSTRRPAQVAGSNRAYSPKNWGHDPAQ